MSILIKCVIFDEANDLNFNFRVCELFTMWLLFTVHGKFVACHLEKVGDLYQQLCGYSETNHGLLNRKTCQEFRVLAQS